MKGSSWRDLAFKNRDRCGWVACWLVVAALPVGLIGGPMVAVSVLTLAMVALVIATML